MATPIAHKGVIAGAKVQAMTMLDILLDLPRDDVDERHQHGCVRQFDYSCRIAWVFAGGLIWVPAILLGLRFLPFFPITDCSRRHVLDGRAQPFAGAAVKVRGDARRRPGATDMDIRRLPGHGVKQFVLIL